MRHISCVRTQKNWFTEIIKSNSDSGPRSVPWCLWINPSDYPINHFLCTTQNQFLCVRLSILLCSNTKKSNLAGRPASGPAGGRPDFRTGIEGNAYKTNGKRALWPISESPYPGQPAGCARGANQPPGSFSVFEHKETIPGNNVKLIPDPAVRGFHASGSA